jgi:hypothetical protein
MRAALVSTLLLVVAPISVLATEGQVISSELKQVLQRQFVVSSEIVDGVVGTGLNHEDIVVCFYVAQRANMSPVHVAKIRSQGDSWPDIADRRGLGPWDFYVMVNGELPGQRYPAIMEKLGFLPTSDWSKAPLDDGDIIDLVNVKFVASACDYSIFETIALREEGKEFSQIYVEIADRKHALLEKQREEEDLDYVTADGK